MRRVPYHRRFSELRVPHAITASLAACALLLLSALPAAAQDSAPLSRLDATSHYAIDVIMDSATAEGLPARSILSRTLEGIAKKAENKRIVDAARKRLVSLRSARAALGKVPDGELEAAASILEFGTKPEQLAPFKIRHPEGNALEAFAVWGDFLSRGVPKDEAYSAISKLWQDGADHATFDNLWKNVASDILQGLNPGAALQNRIRESPARGPATPGKPPEGQQENPGSR